MWSHFTWYCTLHEPWLQRRWSSSCPEFFNRASSSAPPNLVAFRQILIYSRWGLCARCSFVSTLFYVYQGICLACDVTNNMCMFCIIYMFIQWHIDYILVFTLLCAMYTSAPSNTPAWLKCPPSVYIFLLHCVLYCAVKPLLLLFWWAVHPAVRAPFSPTIILLHDWVARLCTLHWCAMNSTARLNNFYYCFVEPSALLYIMYSQVVKSRGGSSGRL